jgi:hypothetical protein
MDTHHEIIDATESTYLPSFPLVFVSFALVADRADAFCVVFDMQNLTNRTKIGSLGRKYPLLYFMVLPTRTKALH